MNVINRLPVSFARGEGVWLWDENDKQYLDAMCGVAVCSLGHSHPAVTAAVCDQAGRLMHTSNWYNITLQTQLADKLCALSDMDNAIFCNSGAEANEAAIKLARLYGHQKDIHNPAIIVTEDSFHGRTLATLTATGNRKVQAGFEPLVPGFVRTPFDDLDAINQVGDVNPDVVAVLVEPVQGEGGVIIPDDNYLKGLREICDQRGWLLMLDEIQTGMCRTGQWFATQHEDVRPDVMTLAKALGNGFPIGACLARGKAAGVFGPGNHGTTYGGNPLACRAALAVLEVMEKDNLAQRAQTLGLRMLRGLRQGLEDIEGITDIRGRGLMLAVELDRPCFPVMENALQAGLLINVTAGNVVRLLPPIILSDDEADQVIAGVVKLIREFLGH
ncbi:MAG: aspartate aminotransferase family protein [Gammaproteobacteria bacterium]|nr:MAG: aspartate aminotransferase family protein [Gammaproteobacteria bacterium]